jgi:hypothetical protein
MSFNDRWFSFAARFFAPLRMTQSFGCKGSAKQGGRPEKECNLFENKGFGAAKN